MGAQQNLDRPFMSTNHSLSITKQPKLQHYSTKYGEGRGKECDGWALLYVSR